MVHWTPFEGEKSVSLHFYDITQCYIAMNTVIVISQIEILHSTLSLYARPMLLNFC